jgi:hypothetical protein
MTSIVKFDVCGDKTEISCHRKIGCFSDPERGDFSKNSGILQFMKIGLFWSALSLFYSFRVGYGPVCFHLLVGPAQELLTDLRTETSP